VTVCKPVQTGIAPAAGHGDDDLAEVARLADITSARSSSPCPAGLTNGSDRDLTEFVAGIRHSF